MNRDGYPFDLWLLGLSILVFFCFWYWARHVYIPANAAEVRARNLPVGNNSDLYPRWLGARELLLHKRDPYSPEITREIQTGFYGRPLDPEKKSDPRAQEAFVYPLWVIFLMAPSVTLPFDLAREIFRWILICSTILGAVAWMYIMGFRLRASLVLGVVLLVCSSLPFLVEYYQQNLTALVILFLALAAVSVVRNRLGAAGFLLALSTMKPDTTAPLALWFLIWAASKWRDRQRLLWSLAVTVAVLLVLSEMVLPHWMGHFIAGVGEYPTYGTAPNALQLIFSPFLGTVFSILLLLLLFVGWFRWRTAEAGTRQFRWSIAWTCIVTVAIIPKIAFYNQLLLIPPLLVLLTECRAIQKSRTLPRALASAPFVCLLLHWLAAAGLSIASLLGQKSAISLFSAELPDHVFLATAPLTLLAVVTVTFSSAGAGLLPSLRSAREVA